MNKGIRKILYSVIVILTVALDQSVKYLSVLYLKPIASYPLINGVFHLTYCENTGAAFSMFEGARWGFVVITAVFIVLILYLIYTDRILNMPASYILAFIAAGGIGNLIDRALHGYVVDMFDFKLINFAVFNVADIAVTCGAVAFAVIYIFKKGDMVKWKK